MHRRLAYTKPAMCHAHPSPLGTGQDEVRGENMKKKGGGDEWEQTGKNRRAGKKRQWKKGKQEGHEQAGKENWT